MALSPRTLYDVFFTDSTHHSRAEIEPNGDLKYVTQPGIPELDLIQQHIDEIVVLGAYTVSPGNTTRYIAWDIDSKIGIVKAREIAQKLSDFLTQHNIKHFIEYSGSKGYHIYVFFEDRTDAGRAKIVGEAIREFFGWASAGTLHVEVYPKQAKLDKGKVGSLLRLPLGRHPKTNNKAFFVLTDDWENGEAVDPEKVFSEKNKIEDVEAALAAADPLEELANTLITYWKDGQRHNITLCASGMAVMCGMVIERWKEVVERIHAEVPEGSLDDQFKAVESTWKRFANGEKIIGENGLASFIPGRVLMKIRKLMGKSSSSLVLQMMDAVRLEKNPPFIKVRNAAVTALSYLQENGRLVRDENNVYWLDYSDHRLTMVDSFAWTRLTHNLFGINISESFGRQVAESIRHLAYVTAKQVVVVKRSYWYQKKLYVNLGGPEVYVLDGKTIEVVYNGEIDILFRNVDDTMNLPNLLEEDNMVDPWKMLVHDVNFKEGDTTIAQAKQLMMAYICAMFFPEAMPTRPLLMLLGISGSGKTTTARRILWLIEGILQDVLSQTPDKPDALRASMAAHRMIVIDNIEKSNVSWLPNMLNTAATGSQVELRELHTTNRVQKIIYNVFVCLTGTEIPFSDEAVYSRILPIELEYLDIFQSEEAMRSNIENNFISFWRGFLFELNKVVAELVIHGETNFPSQTRLADFSVFCNRIKGVDFLDGDELLKGLGNLVDRQKEALTEYSPFIGILDGLIKTRPDEMSVAMTVSELYSRSQRYAVLNKQRFDWSTPQGFSKHIMMMEPQLKKHFGMTVRTDREGGREVKKYKFHVASKPVAISTTGAGKIN